MFIWFLTPQIADQAFNRKTMIGKATAWEGNTECATRPGGVGMFLISLEQVKLYLCTCIHMSES